MSSIERSPAAITAYGSQDENVAPMPSPSLSAKAFVSTAMNAFATPAATAKRAARPTPRVRNAHTAATPAAAVTQATHNPQPVASAVAVLSLEGAAATRKAETPMIVQATP